LKDLSAVSDSSRENGKSNHLAVPLGNATYQKFNAKTKVVQFYKQGAKNTKSIK